MKQLLSLLALCLVLTSCDSTEPIGASEELTFDATVSKTGNPKACWGQVSAVYAALGYMGEHSSEQVEPRAGLANLARYLYGEGVIPEPTLQALGEYVATEEGLSIEACGTDEP